MTQKCIDPDLRLDFANAAVLDRLRENLGGSSPLGITADMTLDQIAALGSQPNPQEGA